MNILQASLVSMLAAQLFKPIIYFLVFRKFKWKLIFASGGFPSSHSSLVSTLVISVGFQEGFSSTLFAMTAVFALVVMYDAANVRYYAGKNIQLTKKLIEDLQDMDIYINKFTDPIYNEKIKQILGHKWIEVLFGSILGVIIAIINK